MSTIISIFGYKKFKIEIVIMEVYIKWAGLEVNEDQHEEYVFNLKNSDQINSFVELKNKFPDLCDALFHELSENNLKLKIPTSGYLGTNSYSDQDMILRRFFDDCSANSDEDTKPIILSKETYPKEVYSLFSRIISSFEGDYGWDEPYGILTLIFDDSRGCICSNGEEGHEISITIDENGVQWAWWPNE